MPKDDDGVLDNLDSRVERVEGFSRNHLRRGYGGQGERKRRRDLNHEIHENGRARWSHRNPLSFVVRRPSFPLPITNFSRVERVEHAEGQSGIICSI